MTAIAVGNLPLKLRIRIEAGIGDTLTDVGYADLDVKLPVTTTALTDGPGVSVHIGLDELQQRLNTAVQAIESSIIDESKP